MSFLQKARDAALQAAEQARQASERATEQARLASERASDPATPSRLRQQAREAMGHARRGMKTVIERIDPATLAELIIKATALQEVSNEALRKKGSPYRIGTISITATIPPGVTFAIVREQEGPAKPSTELASEVGHTDIVSLTGDADDAALPVDLPDDIPETLPETMPEAIPG